MVIQGTGWTDPNEKLSYDDSNGLVFHIMLSNDQAFALNDLAIEKVGRAMRSRYSKMIHPVCVLGKACRLQVVAMLFASLVWATGCVPYYQPGSQGFDNSVHIYSSTEHVPTTLMLVDARNNEALWTMEIPPGKWLAVQFVEGTGNPDDFDRPDTLKYQIYDAGKRFGVLRSSITVPDDRNRRLELMVRDAVEYATPDGNVPVGG